VPRQVTAFSNSTVKRLRSLREKKARRLEGLFLAEGLRIIAEARDSGRLPEIVAFSAEGARHPLAADIIAATEAAGGEAIETTADILSKMSGGAGVHGGDLHAAGRGGTLGRVPAVAPQ
jgi:TrmH family RNA methyltransferase